MLIFWQGSGYVIFGILFLCLIAGNLLSDQFLGKGYWESHSWLIGICFMVSAIFSGLFARHKDKEKGRVVIDKETGQEIVLKPHHTFFFIPLKWWPLIYCVIAIIIMVTSFVIN